MHGKTSLLSHDGRGLFRSLPQTLKVMRYHSLTVDRETLPDDLEITAETDDGLVMGLRHKTWPAESDSIFSARLCKQSWQSLRLV